MRKEKMIVSMLIMMLVFAIFSVSVFAASTGNVVTITANTTNISSTYGNSSLTNTESTQDTLPYTGTSGNAMIFIIIAVVISAVYAYRKFKEYNV